VRLCDVRQVAHVVRAVHCGNASRIVRQHAREQHLTVDTHHVLTPPVARSVRRDVHRHPGPVLAAHSFLAVHLSVGGPIEIIRADACAAVTFVWHRGHHPVLVVPPACFVVLARLTQVLIRRTGNAGAVHGLEPIGQRVGRLAVAPLEHDLGKVAGHVSRDKELLLLRRAQAHVGQRSAGLALLPRLSFRPVPDLIVVAQCFRALPHASGPPRREPLHRLRVRSRRAVVPAALAAAASCIAHALDSSEQARILRRRPQHFLEAHVNVHRTRRRRHVRRVPVVGRIEYDATVHVARKRPFAVPGVEACVLVHDQIGLVRHSRSHDVGFAVASSAALERSHVLGHAEQSCKAIPAETAANAFLVAKGSLDHELPRTTHAGLVGMSGTIQTVHPHLIALTQRTRLAHPAPGRRGALGAVKAVRTRQTVLALCTADFVRVRPVSAGGADTASRGVRVLAVRTFQTASSQRVLLLSVRAAKALCPVYVRDLLGVWTLDATQHARNRRVQLARSRQIIALQACRRRHGRPEATGSTVDADRRGRGRVLARPARPTARRRGCTQDIRVQSRGTPRASRQGNAQAKFARSTCFARQAVC